MARDQTWLSKLKSQISNKLIHHPTTTTTTTATATKRTRTRPKSSNVTILSFEISVLLSKLLALHHSLSNTSILHLKNHLISLQGIHKIVSNDESFLLGLACAEYLHSLHLISLSTTRLITSRCTHPDLLSFPDSLQDFATTGRDHHHWATPCGGGNDLDGLIRQADHYVAATSALYREMEELHLLENNLRKKSPSPHRDDHAVLEIKQKIVWQKQEIKDVKEKSLWNRSFDSVVLLLARLIFTVLARIKTVFVICNVYYPVPDRLPRSLSASATVFPSSDLGNPPLIPKGDGTGGFFECRTKALKPPPTTLGAAALSLHYANLIIVVEKMIKAPHLVGLDAREDVYAMLTSSIRSSLRVRLKGVGFSATDPALAGEWRDALARILAWLAPLAHNMIKWQSERSFEQHNLMPKSTNVLLLQTLYFANQEKTEAAITELLVGLNYIWRFEREMNAKALLECSNFFNNNHLHT